MKVDLAFHAALRGIGPRLVSLRGMPRLEDLRGFGPHVAIPSDAAPPGAGPGAAVAAPGVPVRRFASLRGATAAWPARRLAARVAIARWWGDRAPRERWLLAALGALAAAAVVARLVWLPLVAVRQAAQAEIARDDRIAAALRVAGPEVARIAAARRGSLAAVVTDRAARAGLTIARLEPQGAGVVVGLDGVGFDPLLDWLAALDHDAGVVVVELKVDRRPDPGRVTAQVTLAER